MGKAANLIICLFVISGSLWAQPLNVSADVTAAHCDTSPSGEISLKVTGGEAPYQITWNNGYSGGSLTDLVPGEYQVVVTDKNGKTVRQTYRVKSRYQIKATPNVRKIPGGTFYEVSLQIRGGASPVDIYWTGNGEQAAKKKMLRTDKTGYYNAIVRDRNGCAIMVENIAVGL